ncbi:MAG: hypothetical protein ABR924_10305 [Terracidiphilus sp.]|jgi:hypothetical protein
MHGLRKLGFAGFIPSLLLAPLVLAQQAANAPLPEIRQLLSEVDEHQKQLEKVRENYTFSTSQVVEDLDGEGRVTKTESREWEVFFVNGHQIARLVKKDGKPLDGDDLQKETERVTKAVEKAQKPEQEQHKDEKEISLRNILEIADVRNPRREIYRGRSTIVFDFVGRKDLKAHGLSEDLSKKLQGTVWVDEADRQVAHMEATFFDDFHVAGGLLASVRKGSKFQFDQAPVNGEVWLPSGAEITVQMRLVLKGIREHITQRDSDYKRFRVETQQGKDAKVVAEQKP